MWRVCGVLALALGLGLSHSALAGPNLVADGNFSSPSGGGSFVSYAGNSSMGPWTVTGSGVDLIGAYWQAPNGIGGSVDLDGSAPGGLTQQLATAAGQLYQLSFYLSGNPDGSPSVKSLGISIGNLSNSVSYALNSNTHSNMGYVWESFRFVASGPTILSFTSNDVSSPYGPVIGGVSVTAVPEPSSLAICGICLAGLSLVARRRDASRRQAR
jgi:choice-of-anchor C domain-containing protein